VWLAYAVGPPTIGRTELAGLLPQDHRAGGAHLAIIVAIGYPDQGTAEQARGTALRLADELVLRVEQVAVISRDVDGTFHVHTSHEGIPMAGGAIWGGFWGLLFGTLFLIPLAGWALGAGVGARIGYLKEKGIGEDFQHQVRDHLQPGTSALFLVIDQADPDKALAALKEYGGTVIKTTLSDADAKKLQHALGAPVDRAGRLSGGREG
jgi:uncharacterized membrane protein